MLKDIFPWEMKRLKAQNNYGAYRLCSSSEIEY